MVTSTGRDEEKKPGRKKLCPYRSDLRIDKVGPLDSRPPFSITAGAKVRTADGIAICIDQLLAKSRRVSVALKNAITQ
jgi:hypothetical protein